MENLVSKLFILFLSTALLLGTKLIQCTVTYDNQAIVINGQRRILIAGAIHYPRSTPDMWEDLMRKAKAGGIDVIDTYVFWNGHEPSPGVYNFEGNYNLVHFVKTAQKVGLYVMLRIGPYVCAEWKFGGIPVWLKFVPNCTFRTYNKPFMVAMQGFTTKIVQMMKHNKLFESQGKGGPIILSQIENEYGGVESQLGATGKAYMNWTASMAVGLDTGVPWLMCKQPDAPDPVINTFNGFYCNNFIPNQPNKPIMWTETWTGWFTLFAGPIHKRPVEDLAFAVASFIQRGGSFLNYYMYHGGTNFGRTAGGPFITTSYDYDAPIDEYGLIRDPKYTHLKELHSAIKQCEPALVSSDPTVLKLGPDQLAYVFYGQRTCSAFLSNKDTKSAAQVTFNNKHFKLPPWSISIVPNCSNPGYAVFNTAKVRAQTSRKQMVPTSSMIHSWATYREDISSLGESATITANGLMEQLNVTRDASDYLWYITSIDIDPSEKFLRGGTKPTLNLVSKGDGAHVFINGELSGSAYGSRNDMMFRYSGPVNLVAGRNSIALLSFTMGMPNIGLHYETWQQGILGPVTLQGLEHGTMALTGQKWIYKIGMKGEALNLASPKYVSLVGWTPFSSASEGQKPLTWYKAYFDAPAGKDPLALDLLSMGKGEAWINGQSIGRYWTATAVGNCSTCSYAGTFKKFSCLSGCGQPTQRWYHVPRSWLQPMNNLLVIFEELSGDVSKITLVKRTSSY